MAVPYGAPGLVQGRAERSGCAAGAEPASGWHHVNPGPAVESPPAALPVEAIYLDNNASTPLDPAVLRAMVGALERLHGNPSSPHPAGEAAAQALEAARGALARLLGAASGDEIVFTSGGTESANLALHAVLADAAPGLVLTSALEHPCVLRPLERWAARGQRVERVPADADGRIRVELLLERLAAESRSCRLVSLILANNETGVCLTAAELAALGGACARAGVPLHLDAVQAVGKLRLSVAALGADLVSLSGHKFHGPKGSGALWVESGIAERFPALLLGGPQESGRRAGTPNLPGIVGLGHAAELASAFLADESALAEARERHARLEAGLLARIPGASIHGVRAERLWTTTSLCVPGVDAELLVAALAAEGACVSSGSACSSGRRAPSHVLLAGGVLPEDARSTIRLSLSRLTTAEEVAWTLERLPRLVEELRGLATQPAR
jgi:cysteine desulfurase